MKRFTCTPSRITKRVIFALAIGVVMTGCSSAGDDVYVEPRTDQSQSSLRCTITPGENVCTRSWEDAFDASTRPDFLAAASAVVEWAGIARDGREQIVKACGSIIDALGATRPVLAPDAQDKERAKATCDVAVAAIGAVDRSAFSISVTPGTCTEVAPPACAVSTASPRKRCAPPTTIWTLKDGASARDTLVAEALGKNVAFALGAKALLEASAGLSSEVSGNADRLADGPAVCIPRLISMAQAAVDDTTTAAQLSGNIVSAIDPSM